jgi:transcriptional regulator with XRE-family HTH domain
MLISAWSSPGIRQLRKEKAITQNELCGRIDMEQSYLSSIENGKMEPCLRNIELLAIGLKVPLGKIFRDL